MKKLIILSVLVLTSVLTAFSLTKTHKTKDDMLQKERVTVSAKTTSGPKSDLATAD